jgi:quercetin dioxygenase-like cupin family protein
MKGFFMFQKKNDHGYKAVLDKIRQKTLVFGDKSLLTEFRLEQGALLPSHHHTHEQTGYLVSGRMDLTIGDTTHPVEPGDSWCIPGGTPHCAVALADSVAIEVFAPVREDYLP